MAGEKPDVLLIGARKPVMVKGLEPKVTLHYLADAQGPGRLYQGGRRQDPRHRDRLYREQGRRRFLKQFPKLEQMSSFGVGYDHIDAKWAGEHGIVVTNTPEVLNEEVADTALGLLLCTVREFPQADASCAPANGRRGSIRSPRRRCATAPSASSAWAGSARPSPGGSRPSACRSSITAAIRSPA